jgi:hypothetical protein
MVPVRSGYPLQMRGFTCVVSFCDSPALTVSSWGFGYPMGTRTAASPWRHGAGGDGPGVKRPRGSYWLLV